MLSINGFNEVVVFKRKGIVRVNTYWFATKPEALAAVRKTKRELKDYTPKSVEILYLGVRPAYLIVEGEDPKAYSCYYFDTWKHKVHTHPDDTTIQKMSAMLKVKCPKCNAPAWDWCLEPNGKLHRVLHVARWRAAGGN